MNQVVKCMCFSLACAGPFDIDFEALQIWMLHESCAVGNYVTTYGDIHYNTTTTATNTANATSTLDKGDNPTSSARGKAN